jgi:starvation-inducible DNA-binding protein
MSKKVEKIKEINQDKVTAAEVAKSLSVTLASNYVLSVQTLGSHWNVVGSNFVSLHALFETQYEELQAANDEMAERIRAIGYKAPASLQEFTQLSAIKDEVTPKSAENIIKLLLNNNRELAKQCGYCLELAQEANDEVTADIMIGRITTHDKAAWMLQSLLD